MCAETSLKSEAKLLQTNPLKKLNMWKVFTDNLKEFISKAFAVLSAKLQSKLGIVISNLIVTTACI